MTSMSPADPEQYANVIDTIFSGQPSFGETIKVAPSIKRPRR